jgi:C4-dicarboxylate-specific signal transduction histidine kinase
MIALTNEFSEVSSKFSNSQSYLSFQEISRKDFVGLDKSGLFPQLRNDVQTLVEEYLFKKNEAIKQQVIFGQVSSIVTVVGFIFFLFLILAIYRRYQSNAQTLVQVTHSLELERLASIQSSKLASLGEMAAGLAHEINNPLAVIIGRAEMIMTQISEGSATDVEVSKTISKINDMAFRISKIVTSMRKISKGAVNNDLASINLNSVIEDILNLSSERLRTSLISLDRSGVDSDLNVMASFTQLSQVIINLFNNSIDELIKMPEENRSIVLSTEQIGTEVILRISDSGQGIPDAVRKKLFEPFFTTKEVGKGTGLGLSISKGLMIDMGGNLELSPDLNQTCFILKLQKA